ncbi:MAG: hypothetical protein GQ570_00055 [Helicobacteraceae bacterium]|nr:hypothetical protein [Helicobacteraceae bacterium]
MNKADKKVLRVLKLLFIAPLIVGFLIGIVTFKDPEGWKLVGFLGLIGLWMISAVASFLAIKNFMFGKKYSKK